MNTDGFTSTYLRLIISLTPIFTSVLSHALSLSISLRPLRIQSPISEISTILKDFYLFKLVLAFVFRLLPTEER